MYAIHPQANKEKILQFSQPFSRLKSKSKYTWLPYHLKSLNQLQLPIPKSVSKKLRDAVIKI